jgi:hypothetical protein
LELRRENLYAFLLLGDDGFLFLHGCLQFSDRRFLPLDFTSQFLHCEMPLRNSLNSSVTLRGEDATGPGLDNLSVFIIELLVRRDRDERHVLDNFSPKPPSASRMDTFNPAHQDHLPT